MNAALAMGAAIAGGRLLHKNGNTYRVVGPVEIQIAGEWKAGISYTDGRRTYARTLEDCADMIHLPGDPHKSFLRWLGVGAAALLLAVSCAKEAKAEIFRTINNQPYCVSWNSAATFTKAFQTDRETGYEVFAALRDCGFLKADLRYTVLEDSGMESWAEYPARRAMLLGGPTSGYEIWLVLGKDTPETKANKPR